MASAQPEPADAHIDEPPLAPVEERPAALASSPLPPPPPAPVTAAQLDADGGTGASGSTSNDWKSTLTRAQEVHTTSGATGEEHDLLGKMILLVQSLGSTLHHALRDKSDLETQLQLTKSNLQLALANNEMLEDALRDRGANSRDVGWRRSKPPGEVEGQQAVGPRTPSTPNTAPPGATQQPQPVKDTRFLARFRFGSGSTPAPQPQESSPDSPQAADARTHLTSASLPSLPLSNDASQQQAQSPDSAGSGGSRPTLPQLHVGPPSGTATHHHHHHPGGVPPPNTAHPGYTGPPPSAASPIPRPATAHPGMQHARNASYSPMTHMTFPGPGGTFYVTPIPAPTREQHAQVLHKVQRLEEEYKKERAARLALEQELESLTQSLFEEANKMVAAERKARAAADDELNSIRDQRDALHAALKVVERENGVLRGGGWTPASDGARSRADSGASVSSVVGVRAGVDGDGFRLSTINGESATIKKRPSPLHDLAHAHVDAEVESGEPTPALPAAPTPGRSTDGSPETSDIEFAPAPRNLPTGTTDLGDTRASGRQRLMSPNEEDEAEAEAEHEEGQVSDMLSPGSDTFSPADSDMYTPRVDGSFPRIVTGAPAPAAQQTQTQAQVPASGSTPDVPDEFPA